MVSRWVGSTHLEHVQKRRLAGIVETEEQQLGVLVQQAEGGEDIVDCIASPIKARSASCWPLFSVYFKWLFPRVCIQCAAGWACEHVTYTS